MATEQEKLAYELGCAIALAEYQGMTKEAFSPAAIAAISNAWKAGKGISKLTGAASAAVPGYAKETVKFLGGFTGPAPVRHLGSSLGFGIYGAATAEPGLENAIKGFTGGFLGGLAFSGAASLGSRAFKGLNASKELVKSRWMSGVNKDRLSRYEKLLESKGERLAAALKSQDKRMIEKVQKSLSKAEGSYKKFLKKQMNPFDRSIRGSFCLPSAVDPSFHSRFIAIFSGATARTTTPLTP